MSKLKFHAELKQVASKKTASLDMEYRLVLVTDDKQVLDLGKLDGQTLLEIEVNTGE